MCVFIILMGLFVLMWSEWRSEMKGIDERNKPDEEHEYHTVNFTPVEEEIEEE